MTKKLEGLFGEDSQMDKRSAKYILTALEANNQEGYDYLEFKQSLRGMAHLGMEDPLKYQSAFAAASAIGLTRKKLLETASFYRKIVEREKQQFEAAMESKIKSEVADKKEAVAKIEAAINKKYDEIREMKEQIAKFQNKIEKTQEDINGVEGKINTAKDSFEKTHKVIIEHIDKDISKIEEYIK